MDPQPIRPETRTWIARAFTAAGDAVYIGLGLLLAGSALALLAGGFLSFGRGLLDGTLPAAVVPLLDRVLLTLLVVELLYTVQVSFREHALVPEPFLLVGLISAIRRVLVVTAEFGELREKSEDAFRHFVAELSVLAGLVLALAAALLLRRRGAPAVAERA